MMGKQMILIGGLAVPLTAAMWLMAQNANAGTVSGQVRDAEGQPIAGAIVSVGSAARGITDSVYTNAEGRYTHVSDLAGKLKLRFRKRYYRDDAREIALSTDAELEVNADLAAVTDPKELSDEHPPLSHFSMIDFDEDENALFSRANFARDCLSCHALGNAFTRWERPAEGWVPTVQRMHGYLASAVEDPIKQRAEILARAFDGRLATSKPVVPTDPVIYTAKLREWRLDGTVVPHDAEYVHSTGKIYLSEMFTGEVLETDLATGETLHFKLPADGLPPGGAFTQAGLPAPYGLTIPRAPHSLAEGADGKIYLTDSIGSAVTTFDPKTRAFENFQVGNGALYPHTVRADAKGVIWFTIAFSEQVGRFDPKTRDMGVINLPEAPSLSTPGASIPYGVAVSPIDGGIWYARLASDKIGRIDPETLAVKEYDSPVRAPRRQRFDAAGKLWVAGFSDGAVAKIDVDSWQVTVYPLPIYAPGEIPAPYALAIHPQTQDVWVNDTMLDVVWRFLVAEERFVAYPMPLRGTYTRDFTFTDQGWACTANNPIPAPALEGGVPELICIDPGDVEVALSRR
ncbi:MAG TPA: carboxypeptidase regulatory-like domain-containing protein [Gammaproteobacteria bacterium]|nr:carboxypeptidase regulatory-like domain-containing protein [Gammaproteobacteria bacterium]